MKFYECRIYQVDIACDRDGPFVFIYRNNKPAPKQYKVHPDRQLQKKIRLIALGHKMQKLLLEKHNQGLTP